MLEDEHGEPLAVGRKTRSIPPAIRRALHTRDGGCQSRDAVPPAPPLGARGVDPDRDASAGRLAFLASGRPALRGDPLHADPDVRRGRAGNTHATLGIDIDSDTAATRWQGEPMDYELGVWVLCHQKRRTRRTPDVSAETSAPMSEEASAEMFAARPDTMIAAIFDAMSDAPS